VKESLEDLLQSIGATSVRIDLGPDVYLDFDGLDGEPSGWRVIDNRRRYPSEAAANLTFDHAVRYAKNLRTPRPTDTKEKRRT
jgi:hypothetical protein